MTKKELEERLKKLEREVRMLRNAAETVPNMASNLRMADQYYMAEMRIHEMNKQRKYMR